MKQQKIYYLILFLLPFAEIYSVTAQSVSGTVFEDANYGGGAGRSFAAASGNAIPGATVELYSNTGSFLQTTSTNTSGIYTFTGLTAATYQIRVVNQSVTSSRTGYISGLLPVQVYKTDAATGTAMPVTDRVGGEIPAEQDAPANTGSATLATLDAVAGQEVQSITSVLVAAGGITGIDFGFNFDLIVNTNDAGQGSLRQFIINAANLGGENYLSQDGLTWNAMSAYNISKTLPPGKESSIFMISDGNAHPGLRAGLSNLLSVNGIAIINTSATIYPSLAYSYAPNPDNTSVDGGTQTANVGNTNNIVLGFGGTAGIGADATEGTCDELLLPQINGPEIEIAGVAGQYPIQIYANSVTVRCLSIHSNAADIHVIGGSNCLIEQNIIGASANSFTAPAVKGGASRAELYIENAAVSGTVQNNLVGFSTQAEIMLRFYSNNFIWNVRGNEITGGTNGAPGPGPGIIMNDNMGTNTASAGGNVMIMGNLIRDCGPAGISTGIHYDLAHVNSMATTIQENTLIRNDAGMQALFGNGNDVLVHNLIASNRSLGIRVANRSTDPAVVTSKVTITQNSIYNNGTTRTTGGLGIDLNEDNVSGNNGVYTASLPNLGVNYPVFSSMMLTGSTLTASGYIGSSSSQPAFANATIELFKANNSDNNQNGEIIAGDGQSAAHGEGQRYLGSITADANGNFSGSISVTGLTINDTLTATATDVQGNTSEFNNIQALLSLLPVKFTQFSAQIQKGDILLNWTAEKASAAGTFYVMRSADNITYSTIGAVAFSNQATDLTNYSFTDNVPGSGRMLYRIKQADVNAQVNYSDIKAVYFNAPMAAIQVWPNPASSFVTFSFGDGFKDIAVRILNTAGQQVISRKINNAGTIKINTSLLTRGVYYAEVNTATGIKILPLVIQ